MDFEMAEIPLQSYSNRSRYLHKLMNLIERLLIGDIDRRTPSLRIVRVRLMDFWLSKSYLGGARKTPTWTEHAQVIWACICRLSSLLMDERDYETSRVEGLEDRIPHEIVPHIDDPVPETIIKIDMITFWRSVRIILEYVATSERARYTVALVGHITSLVLACSRFMTRTFPSGSPDLNLPIYRRSVGPEGREWAISQRFIVDTEDAFHSIYLVLRLHQEVLKCHKEHAKGPRKTAILTDENNFDRPLQSALYVFFVNGNYRDSIVRYLAKRVYDLFVSHIEKRTFSHLYPYDEPNALNVLAKYRPHVIDKLHALLSKTDDEIYSKISSEDWLVERVLPFLLTVVLDYFVKVNAREPVDLENSHIFIGQLDEGRLVSIRSAEELHPVLFSSFNEWFVVRSGAILAKGTSFVAALSYWIRVSQLILPRLTALASIPTETAREKSRSDLSHFDSLVSDVEQLPPFYHG